MKDLLKVLASIRLTVTLLALTMVLVFVGTLAQVRMGVWEAVDTYFRSLIAWVDVSLVLPGIVVPDRIKVPIPGGFAIGLVMSLNLIAAHIIRFRMIPSRIGIVLLHAGIIVLLIGEFVTGAFSREGLMRIDVGSSSNYVEDIRTAELAIIDTTDPSKDRVISIPGSMIARAAANRTRIEDETLPFGIEVLDWMPNAQLFRAQGETIADQGIGTEAFAEEMQQVRGVDGGAADAPAAYVTLYKSNERIGTWLVSADLINAQAVNIDDEEYGIALRFTRTYKPYTLFLHEFRHDKFTGTEMARNFSSRVQLIDPRSGTDREVVIWMNNPLRHAGETFYQASYKQDGSGTVLQVVKNPGALLPYIASGLVAFGMTLHFILSLVGYLRKERTRVAPAPSLEGSSVGRPRLVYTLYPWAVGVIGLLIACSSLLRPTPKSEYDIDTFAVIPVSSGGRVKPMDTAARHLLSVSSGRQSIRTEGTNIPATEFLLHLIARPDAVKDLPVVRVDHPDVLALLDLRPEDAGRISLDTIEKRWDMVAMQAMRAFSVPPRERDAFQKGVIALHDRVNELLAYAAMEAPYGIPPHGPDADWAPFSVVFTSNERAQQTHPAVAYHVAMMTAWNEQDPQRFNRAVDSYVALLDRDLGSIMRDSRLEVLFNRARLFAGSMVVYTLAFLMICLGLLLRMRSDNSVGNTDRGDWFRRGGVALLWAAVIIHTLAILIRIHLQGRPPVTNLYSSAIFVGWASVLLGLLLEHLYRLGVAALGAAAVGFSTLVIAHNLGTDGDTMQMMQAVLDSNFWLATHVITITLGYSATFLAGALGIVYLVLGVFTRHLTAERARALTRMVYGVVCFALLLSFVGTMLGGIWADQSWGRFWGWDPKENGAALVVLIAAIILHARWAGLIRERGIMVLAVFGNIVTAWSWFGTNMLGVGLHSYGFMDSAVFWMLLFVASQLLIMGSGMIPVAMWRSSAR